MSDDITFRSATKQDEKTIKRMVHAARLDPTSLKWQNFMVAEHAGRVVSIGQIKQYPGCQEMGSLVTLKSHQGRGIASRMIAELEARAQRPLYLLCESKMEPFYQRFDYETIGYWQAPAFLKLKLTPALLFRLFGIRVLVMRKDT